MTATLTRTALAALLVLGASAGAQPVALVGGRVHTGDGTVLDNATVVIEDGRIAAVEVGMAPPAGARTIDVQGRWVTPGLFDTYSQVGLIEIGTSTAEGRLGENDVSASFQVFEAVNPASQLIPVTRAAGITTVVAAPSGGLISGQAAVLRLAGETLDEVVVDPSVAVVAHLDAGSRSAGGGSRAGAVARLVVPQATIRASLVQMGPHRIDYSRFDWAQVDQNPFFCADPVAAAEWEKSLRICALRCTRTTSVPIRRRN